MQVPAARPWGDVLEMLTRRWRIGQHMALLARTRSGKTTFARNVLGIRGWVVVFGTKPRDDELYGGFEREGYVIKDRWDPEDTEHNRVIFRPAGGLTDVENQRRAFTRALEQIYEVGRWTVYIDEVLVLSRDLGMERILNRMWTQAASNDVTMVAGSQRPRGVPMNMLEQSEWFALWRIADQEDRDRAAEVLGATRGLAIETMIRLPRYELLLVNVAEDEVWRTKVNV